jgi:hypothetical protein
MADLDWKPSVSMRDALTHTFDAYIDYLEQAKGALYDKP